MMKLKLFICAPALLCVLSAAVLAQQQQRRDVLPSGPPLKLEDLEAMALQRNPTLAQAEAAVRAAAGRQRQAGLFPNPVAGYFIDEFAFRSPGETAEHGAFIEQTIPLGGKLSKARNVFAREEIKPRSTPKHSVCESRIRFASCITRPSARSAWSSCVLICRNWRARRSPLRKSFTT
jgi:hypothetical protein